MEKYRDLAALLIAEEQLNWQGTLFTNKHQWRTGAAAAAFIYLEGDDELEDIIDDETLLPRLAKETIPSTFLMCSRSRM